MNRPPNIVLTIADDQRFDALAALGNPVIQTPHFDAMTRAGTAFTAAHHLGSRIGAVCAPSRAMLLSGRSLFHLPEDPQELDARSPNPPPLLPQLLRESGYQTHGVGKGRSV